jgi:guanosine-3',5'-bis(diphosphate) 3'-pyrophosphohydrolase
MIDEDLSLIVRAMAFAADKHRDQRRKDACGSPYINHPLALVDVLVHEGQIVETEIIVAALLHDTIEDTDATGHEIEGLFGALVRSIVEEVTDDTRLDRQRRKRRQVEKAPFLSPQARAVKLADKICNLRDVVSNPPAGWELERRQAYFDWAKEVIDGLRGMHAGLEQVFDEVYRQRPD